MNWITLIHLIVGFGLVLPLTMVAIRRGYWRSPRWPVWWGRGAGLYAFGLLALGTLLTGRLRVSLLVSLASDVFLSVVFGFVVYLAWHILQQRNNNDQP